MTELTCLTGFSGGGLKTIGAMAAGFRPVLGVEWNPVPISHTPEEFPVSLWQRYASPVWMDIRAGRTLQKQSAREEDDERHICPLQLDVIERGIELWSAPDDLVFSPFAGIGSEGHVALTKGRRFVGAELKRSYWELAARNLAAAKSSITGGLFDFDALPESGDIGIDIANLNVSLCDKDCFSGLPIDYASIELPLGLAAGRTGGQFAPPDPVPAREIEVSA